MTTMSYCPINNIGCSAGWHRIIDGEKADVNLGMLNTSVQPDGCQPVSADSACSARGL